MAKLKVLKTKRTVLFMMAIDKNSPQAQWFIHNAKAKKCTKAALLYYLIDCAIEGVKPFAKDTVEESVT